MIRNSNSVVTSTPVLNHKRSRIKVGPVDHFSSSQHGRLTPNFIKPVFPGDTFTLNDFAGFCYADKSQKLPLQDIMYDQFFFFVPFRIIDRNNWEKVLGYRDKVLDKKTYSIPQLDFELDFAELRGVQDFEPDSINLIAPHLLFSFLGYNVPDNYENYKVEGSAYPLMAYWTIWNEFFRDENLDDTIDIDTSLASLYQSSLTDNLISLDASDFFAQLESLHIIPERVNKLSDILTRGMLSPQKSPDGNAVPIYLAGLAPLKAFAGTESSKLGNPLKVGIGGGTAANVNIGFDGDGNLTSGADVVDNITGINLYADLQDAAGFDINQVRLAWSIQELYETKAKTGSRYISYIRGVWGVVVPDSVLDRPEYLGGSRVTLNNMPVLNTASDLGLFSGYSATLFNGSQFDKTFLEYGFVIGVHCERVFHTYPQGIDEDVWLKQVELDLYNPLFAGIGNMAQKKHLIYGSDHTVFNYQEAWPLERSQLPRCSGIFGSLGGTEYQEYREKWLYADYYDEAPTYNSKWLKEPTENVARTLTGELIVNAPDPTFGFQYMFDFKFVYTLTRIIPVDSQPAKLFTRW